MADAVHFVGVADADWSRKHLGGGNAVQIPLAVASIFLAMPPGEDPIRGQTILAIDKLGAAQHRNAIVRFLSRHWSVLRARHPNARLVVVGGSGMPDSFQEFVRRLPGVELYAWVEHLEELMSGTGVAVFPYSVAVGMKNRVMQCMGAGMAVVGDPSSFSGLPVRSGHDAVVCETHDAMARTVGELLGDPARSRRIGAQARVMIRSGFTTDAVGCSWERLYTDVAAGIPISSRYGGPISAEAS
jgi:hypothetical protein